MLTGGATADSSANRFSESRDCQWTSRAAMLDVSGRCSKRCQQVRRFDAEEKQKGLRSTVSKQSATYSEVI